jgi:hypothetical protein
MKEQFITSGKTHSRRIGFIFTFGGTVRDICECDPIPENFSMMAGFLKTNEGCEVEAYVTGETSMSAYEEKHVLVTATPPGCRKPRLCVESKDLKDWFIEKCKSLSI